MRHKVFQSTTSATTYILGGIYAQNERNSKKIWNRNSIVAQAHTYKKQKKNTHTKTNETEIQMRACDLQHVRTQFSHPLNVTKNVINLGTHALDRSPLMKLL